MEEGRKAFKMLTGTSIQKRPLGRPRLKWEDDIRMRLKEMLVGINTRNWVYSAQDRDYWRALERGIEPTSSISHGVCIYVYIFIYL